MTREATNRPISIERRRHASINRRDHRRRSRGETPAMTQPVNVEHQRHRLVAVALRLRGRGMKVMLREAIAFGVAFALSLAVSVAIVELIWRLI
jgi:hypothetical protein